MTRLDRICKECYVAKKADIDSLSYIKDCSRQTRSLFGLDHLGVYHQTFPKALVELKTKQKHTMQRLQRLGILKAAKLKAAREERMKKEEEEKQMKPPPFKARPAPKMKDSTAPAVRQTAASRARLGQDASSAEAGNGLRRASSVRESTAATKRMSTVSFSKPSTNGNAALPRSSTAHDLRKRTSSVSAAFKPGNSTGPSQRVTSGTASGNGTATKKGKEVFGRAAAGKEAEEAKRREKEDAAKKARAEAAERGRVASREWAAKMKARKDKEKEKNKESVIAPAVAAA